MSGVLIGQSYFLRFDPKLEAAAQPYAPLGALYAAAHLRASGHEVALFDAMLASSERGWDRSLERERPRLAVIYEDSFNYLSKMCLLRMRKAALTMIAMARQRGVPVVVAGSDATDHPDEYLSRGARAVILGEGELTLAELADEVLGRSHRGLAAVAGLAYREADGSTARTAPRPVIRDLDALPVPAWDLVDVQRYRNIWTKKHGFFSMNLVTTRGCPYHCNWCAKPIYGQRYTVRTPGSVAEEMGWLMRTYAPDHLAFADDIFGLRPGWVEEFAEAVGERGVPIPFKCLCRVDLLQAPVVGALARAGCRTVWVGAESGAQRILDAMEKGTRVEQIHAATRRLREAGIEVGFFVQFGYPSETREDIAATLRLIDHCRPDHLGVSVSYPLPGTPFHARVADQLGPRRNWEDSDDLAMLYRGPFGTAFYRTLHRAVHRRFRLRNLARDLRRVPSVLGRARRAASVLTHAAALPLDHMRLAWLGAGTGEVAPPSVGLTPERAARPSEEGA